jgi:hypothetical protein
MEQHGIACDNHSDQRPTPKRGQPGDLCLPKLPSTQNGPSLLNDGPELLRSSHC